MNNNYLELAKELKGKSVEDIALQLEKIDNEDFSGKKEFDLRLRAYDWAQSIANRNQYGVTTISKQDVYNMVHDFLLSKENMDIATRAVFKSCTFPLYLLIERDGIPSIKEKMDKYYDALAKLLSPVPHSWAV